MADYTPVYGRPTTMTLTAGATITGGDVLVFSAADTVVPSAVNPANYAGIAAHDAVSGAPVTVYMGAGIIHETAVAGATSADVLLYAGAAGKITSTIGTGFGAVAVGVSLRATAGAGTLRWKAL